MSSTKTNARLSNVNLNTVVPLKVNNVPGMTGSNNLKMKNTEEESAVIVKNLCKGYGKGELILNNLCMNVKKGTIYGLLGSSGCGKTTALSCIVGLKKWESGEIYVFGKWWTKESSIPGKRLGYVPQDIALYDQLSIKENVQYYGRLFGLTEYEILERWQFLVSLLQLPSEFKMSMNLSGGQRRRTSLALALVHNPDLLILDEPTVGLDPLLRESVWKHLFKLVQNNGSTIIITTHYIEEARFSNTIGVIRHGTLICENSPAYLMAKHKVDLLEDVVLKLCWEETKMRKIRKQSINNNMGPHNDKNLYNAKVPNCQDTNVSIYTQQVPTQNRKSSEIGGYEGGSVTFQSKWKAATLEGVMTETASTHGRYHKCSEFDSPVPTLSSSGSLRRNPKTSHCVKESRTKLWISDMISITQRIRAFSTVIYLSLIRHPIFFLAALVLPAVEVLITISSIGKEPRGLTIGVVNEEIPDWITRCSFGHLQNKESDSLLNISLANTTDDDLLRDCNFNELSCKYLNVVSKEDFLHLIPYATKDEAENAIRSGDIWGMIHFSKNYSQYMLDRLATKQFAFEETLRESMISVKMDMSEYLGSVMIIKELFEGLQEYIKSLIDACDLGAEQANIPLYFRPPVYGTLEADYHSYVIPGVLANIMFMMPFCISGITFITDLKLGTLGRARVAGLGTLELMLTYVITQGSIVIGQIIICTLCLKIGFNFEIVGSTLLYIAITFLCGMCGQVFGLLIGIICRDEIEGLIVALFILPTMLMFGGVIWPVYSIAPPWKYLSVSLPTTLITESLRSTATRGVGLTHRLMWPGLLVTTGWGIFFWIGCIVAYKIYIK